MADTICNIIVPYSQNLSTGDLFLSRAAAFPSSGSKLLTHPWRGSALQPGGLAAQPVPDPTADPGAHGAPLGAFDRSVSQKMCNYKRCTVLPVCKKEMPSPCGKRCNELKNGDISDILASMETHFKQRNETNGRNSNDISGFGAFRGYAEGAGEEGVLISHLSSTGGHSAAFSLEGCDCQGAYGHRQNLRLWHSHD